VAGHGFALVVDDCPEVVEKAAEVRGAEIAGVPIHDVGHDGVGSIHLPAATSSGYDELGSAVGRVRLAFHVAHGFEVVDDHADHLLHLAGQPRQISRPDTFGTQVGQHRTMARGDVV